MFLVVCTLENAWTIMQESWLGRRAKTSHTGTVRDSVGRRGAPNRFGSRNTNKLRDTPDRASEKQWVVTRCNTGKGLLSSFDGLASPGFDAKAIQPAVANFYERAAEYDMDVWSEWSGLFKPFGFLVASLFGRRLEQLNLPLSSLDTSWVFTERDANAIGVGW